MRRFITATCLLLAMGFGHAALNHHVWQMRASERREIPAGYVLPSKFSRILAFGHKGVLADFLFLKVSTFYGERHLNITEFSDDDWVYLVSALDVITDLDPYFSDPYIMGQAILGWEGRVSEAIHLLEKGRKYRIWDWRMPYYIGFNYFYFMEEYGRAAEYMMEAARHPDSHAFLKPLAARLSYYAGKSQTGVLFLREMIAESDSPNIQAALQVRLQALESAALLENLIERFIAERGVAPEKIEDLVSEGYLAELPVEPYGGNWIILKTGRVFSTSKFTKREG